MLVPNVVGGWLDIVDISPHMVSLWASSEVAIKAPFSDKVAVPI